MSVRITQKGGTIRDALNKDLGGDRVCRSLSIKRGGEGGRNRSKCVLFRNGV